MTPYHTETLEYGEHTIHVDCHPDEHLGPPREEHDGHGPVSDWTTRGKRPGELVLAEDGRHRRYYDFEEAVRIARRDGWDAKPYNTGQETKRQQAAKAAWADYRHLKAWCNDEWHWMGYTTRIVAPDGTETWGYSCWGFDDESYMVREALEIAQAEVDSMIETEEQTELAACWP